MSDRTNIGDTTMTDWQPISTAPSDTLIDTKIVNNGKSWHYEPLKRVGSLWWSPAMNCYCLYSPTHWKPRTESQETP